MVLGSRNLQTTFWFANRPSVHFASSSGTAFIHSTPTTHSAFSGSSRPRARPRCAQRPIEQWTIGGHEITGHNGRFGHLAISHIASLLLVGDNSIARLKALQWHRPSFASACSNETVASHVLPSTIRTFTDVHVPKAGPGSLLASFRSFGDFRLIEQPLGCDKRLSRILENREECGVDGYVVHFRQIPNNALRRCI